VKIVLQPETFLERLALAFNVAPVPLAETQVAFNAARAIMAGATLGVFEAVGPGPLLSEEVARRCGTHPGATRQLLHCLTGIGYLTHHGGRFALPPRLRKWLLRDSPTSVVDKLAFQMVEWNWMARLEDFVRTGVPLDFHANMTAAEWSAYQKGMRDLSATLAADVAKKLVLPRRTSSMLDIGGSHGLYSIALCEKHPALTSTILELPGALDQASELVEQHGLGDRVKHRAGDALTDDLGTEAWDLVFVSNLVHHFSPEQNASLSARAFRALKPGGLFVIGELLRGEVPGEGGAVGATSDLYFALTSASGTWSLSEIQGWMRQAGFGFRRTLRYVGLPYVSVVGEKRV
jgi:SAM-dependent methyltransferase